MTDKNDTKRGIEAADSREAQVIRLSAEDQRIFVEAILNPLEQHPRYAALSVVIVK
jgi:hypothetical protein